MSELFRCPSTPARGWPAGDCISHSQRRSQFVECGIFIDVDRATFARGVLHFATLASRSLYGGGSKYYTVKPDGSGSRLSILRVT
jgi:hypothetical protein